MQIITLENNESNSACFTNQSIPYLNQMKYTLKVKNFKQKSLFLCCCFLI